MAKRRHRQWYPSHIQLDVGGRLLRSVWLVDEPLPSARLLSRCFEVFDVEIEAHEHSQRLARSRLGRLARELFEPLTERVLPCRHRQRKAELRAIVDLMSHNDLAPFLGLDGVPPRTASQGPLDIDDLLRRVVMDTPGRDPSPDDLAGGRLHASLTRGGSRRRRRAEGSLFLAHNHDPLVRKRRPRRRLRTSTCTTPHPTPTIRIRPPAARLAGPCTGRGVGMSLLGQSARASPSRASSSS